MALNKEQRTYLANHGVITEGITVTRPNKSTAILDLLFHPANPSKIVHYDFQSTDKRVISGKSNMSMFASFRIYFSLGGKKIQVIYDPANPELNDLYFPRYYNHLKEE